MVEAEAEAEAYPTAKGGGGSGGREGGGRWEDTPPFREGPGWTRSGWALDGGDQGGAGLGLGALRGTLKVLGVSNNQFLPEPFEGVEGLGLEHHDLPRATTNEEVDEMLSQLFSAING